MRGKYRRIAAVLITSGMFFLVLAGDAQAQFRGHYIPGFTGLQNGTQAPPGIGLFTPVYFYTTDDLKNDEGESIGGDARINSSFIGLGIAWVTNAKILGANLGGSVLPIAFAKSRIESDSLDVSDPFAFTDIYVQPIQLGWKTQRADFVVAYNLFLPTGEWEFGGDDNAGLGMWSNLFQAGTTLRLDAENAWTFSTLASYEIHSDKEDTDIQVGDILTLEGGLGRTFLKTKMAGETPVPSLVANVGLVYYSQFKVTADEAGILTPRLGELKDRVYAAGLEGNVVIPQSRLSLGLRIEREFGARNRTQGWAFMFTAAYVVKSLATD